MCRAAGSATGNSNHEEAMSTPQQPTKPKAKPSLSEPTMIHRRLPRRARRNLGAHQDAIYCQVCEEKRLSGSAAIKVCAYCGMHVCWEHYSKIVKGYCQVGEYGYLDNYYLHQWYNHFEYHDETKRPNELRELMNTGVGSPIEIVGFRRGKLVVRSMGAKIRGRFIDTADRGW
jgi:hypothetical protein